MFLSENILHRQQVLCAENGAGKNLESENCQIKLWKIANCVIHEREMEILRRWNQPQLQFVPENASFAAAEPISKNTKSHSELESQVLKCTGKKGELERPLTFYVHRRGYGRQEVAGARSRSCTWTSQFRCSRGPRGPRLQLMESSG